MKAAPASIEVAVCTFRRPDLARTLASLDRQDRPRGVAVSILVIDNDAAPTAAPLVERFASTARLPVRYVHCPGANISIARNGALDHASARHLAFIDDDEEAGRGWISALVAAAESQKADVVLGPVRALYEAGAPTWMRRLDPHSTAPVEVAGTIRTGYCCNVLVDLKSAAVAGLRFDPALGRSGGEDTAFFSEAFRRGARIVHAPDALVTEAVVPERACFAWLARRRFRSGQTHGRLLADEARGPRRLAEIGIAALKFGYCAFAALAAAADTERRNAALLRGSLHGGAITGLAGMRPITIYSSSTDGQTE